MGRSPMAPYLFYYIYKLIFMIQTKKITKPSCIPETRYISPHNMSYYQYLLTVIQIRIYLILISLFCVNKLFQKKGGETQITFLLPFSLLNQTNSYSLLSLNLISRVTFMVNKFYIFIWILFYFQFLWFNMSKVGIFQTYSSPFTFPIPTLTHVYF